MQSERRPNPSVNTGKITCAEAVQSLMADIGHDIVGKEHVIKLLVTCFLAQGHVLLEDRPGVGKSTLAKAFARGIGLPFKRIQMTSDLLPVDVVGGSLPGEGLGNFVFRKGPVFAPILFVDELNRASARTQSALLEAMEERSVTCDGITHALPEPFFVIATQNPTEHPGTHALPDSQLDRFLMKLSMGLPSREQERTLLTASHKRSSPRTRAHPQLGPAVPSPLPLMVAEQGSALEHWTESRELLETVQVSRSVMDYVLDLLEFSRRYCAPGLSPRAGIGLLTCAKAWALLEGRNFMIPDDVRAVFPSVARHRLGTPSHPDFQRKAMNNVSSKTSTGSASSPTPPSAPEEPEHWVLSQVPIRL